MLHFRFAFALIVLAVSFCAVSSFGQRSNEPARFAYHISGTVTDERSRPAVGIHVCWIPAERPINGRIPCFLTDAKGHYDFTVQDIPDKYTVYASDSKDAPFTAMFSKKARFRAASSEVLQFGAKDESRTINLQLKKPNR